jgi:hypothetical protein
MSQAELDKYVQWTKDGKSFSEIREDLQKQGYSEPQIKEFILRIDDMALQDALGTQTGIQSKASVIIGGILLAGGIALAFGVRSYLGSQAYMGPMSFFWIVVTPIAVGASLIFIGVRPRKSVADRRKFKSRS